VAAILDAHMSQNEVSAWQGVCSVAPEADIAVAQQLALRMGTCTQAG
jgi:hypothetical protein